MSHVVGTRHTVQSPLPFSWIRPDGLPCLSPMFSFTVWIEGTMELGFQVCQERLGGDSVGRMFA